MFGFKKKGSLGAFIGLVVSASLLLSGCGEQNTLDLSGTVESTQIDVNSEVAGKVISIAKDEGMLVKKGDVLAEVDSSTQGLAVKQQEAVVRLKQARLDELKAGSRAEQIRQAEAAVKSAKAKLDELKIGTRSEQIKQAEAAVESAKSAVETAKINYDYWLDKLDRVKELRGSDAVSENDLKDAQNRVDTANQQYITATQQLKSTEAQLELLKNGASSESVRAAQAGYEQAQAQLDLLKKGSTSQSIDAAQADLEQSQAALEQAKLNFGKFQIKAPIDGTYLLRNINVGDIVNTGTGIGTISDLKELTVKLYIPQKYIKLVSLNKELKLESVSLPGKAINGKIIYIADQAEFTPKNIETSEAKENTVFKLKVRIMDNIENLKPGMTVNTVIPIGGK